MYSVTGTITLCNTPFTSANSDVVLFSDRTAQLAYFTGCAVYSFSEYNVMKKEQGIKVAKNAEELYNCNYVFYQNSQMGNKWIFAFINSVDYLSEGSSFLHLTTDVFQTWCFDVTYKKSFIERQHSAVDYVNTIADNLDVGQMVRKGGLSIDLSDRGGYFAFFSATPFWDNTSEGVPYSFKCGKYSIPLLTLFWESSAVDDMNLILQRIANKGRGDRCLSVVYVPFIGNKALLSTYQSEEDVGTVTMCRGIAPIGMTQEVVLAKPTVSSYAKGNTYPFTKVVITDTATGQTVDLAPEKFEGSVMNFEIFGSIGITSTVIVTPFKYCGTEDFDYTNALKTKCTTVMPTSNNLYSEFMMKNGESLNTAKFLAGFTTLMSGVAVANGNLAGIGGVVGGLGQIQSIDNQISQAGKLGNQVSNFGDDSMNRIEFNNMIKIDYYSFDEQHQRQCEDFWNRYGYPVHAVDYPNLTQSFLNHNYVKLVEPNIVGGNIAQDDLQKYKDLFSKGITIWHSAGDYLNY